MFEMICKMQPILHCQLEGVSSEVIDEGTQEKQFDIRTWLIERRSMYQKQEGMSYSQV